MLLDDLRHNVQPHPKARDRSLTRIKRPREALKDFLALFPWDAHALIAHTDGDGLYGSAHLNLDQMGIRSIFDGIADQVDEDLFKLAFVPNQQERSCSTHHNGMGRAHLL